jgi:hypothetical protein
MQFNCACVHVCRSILQKEARREMEAKVKRAEKELREIQHERMAHELRVQDRYVCHMCIGTKLPASVILVYVMKPVSSSRLVA